MAKIRYNSEFKTKSYFTADPLEAPTRGLFSLTCPKGDVFSPEKRLTFMFNPLRSLSLPAGDEIDGLGGSICTDGGTVWMTGASGYTTNSTQGLVAFDLNTGECLQYSNSVGSTAPGHNGFGLATSLESKYVVMPSSTSSIGFYKVPKGNINNAVAVPSTEFDNIDPTNHSTDNSINNVLWVEGEIMYGVSDYQLNGGSDENRLVAYDMEADVLCGSWDLNLAETLTQKTVCRGNLIKIDGTTWKVSNHITRGMSGQSASDTTWTFDPTSISLTYGIPEDGSWPAGDQPGGRIGPPNIYDVLNFTQSNDLLVLKRDGTAAAGYPPSLSICCYNSSSFQLLWYNTGGGISGNIREIIVGDTYVFVLTDEDVTHSNGTSVFTDAGVMYILRKSDGVLVDSIENPLVEEANLNYLDCCNNLRGRLAVWGDTVIWPAPFFVKSSNANLVSRGAAVAITYKGANIDQYLVDLTDVNYSYLEDHDGGGTSGSSASLYSNSY